MSAPAPSAGGGVPLAQALRRAPKLASPRAPRARLAEFCAEKAGAEIAELAKLETVRALLEGIAGHSPYLWSLARQDAPRLARLLRLPPDESLARLLDAMAAALEAAQSAADAMPALRKAKQEAALLIALADLGGVWDLGAVTGALSLFADAAVSGALNFLLRGAALAGKLLPPDGGGVTRGCGVCVLALGKHGARELNYSSDTDLVVLYDPAAARLAPGAEPAPFYVRLTRDLAALLQERTGEGYVLRVDLRLRPDPGSTAAAVSIPAAMDYYESVGQNWERAAFIKARAVAGDIDLGKNFLAGLAPFIWRKYFDYAAIADIHAMKRQIHAVRGHAEVAVAGHDVKLGRGGIREVEFFVQTQQLIFGGKRANLRGAQTLGMLEELCRDGWVKAPAVKDLSGAYVFLREIEHRLQMIADEQTQRLPSGAALRTFARFCGFGGTPGFSRRLTRHLRAVERCYARLFEASPGLDTQLGSLVFAGAEDDPATLVTLRKMGFRDAPLAAETIRGWHFGRRAAIQSPRAREVLTELVPPLLEAFAGSGEPDTALLAFDAALARMPAAVELLSILKSNADIRGLFADILGGAPRLAESVIARPHVLDAAIDSAPAGAGPGPRAYAARARRLLAAAPRAEDFLDACRDMAHEEKFLTGARMLAGTITAAAAGRAFSALADALTDAALAHAQHAFETEYGRVAGGRCAVLGMGKLGSREMTAASDLDLIVIYDFDPERPESRGPRSLHASQYHTRLAQRLVSSLTAATRGGTLYNVDLRLRPSGNRGPVAVQLSAFKDYQKNEAETWEHMALTRARVICGDASLALDVRRAVRQILAAPRDETPLRREVLEMRRLIAAEKGESDPWDLKLASGGIVDIEFLAQYWCLRHAARHPAVLDTNTLGVIGKAARLGLICAGDAELLSRAGRLYAQVTQMQRLAVNGRFDPDAAAPGVLRRIALAANVPDFKHLARTLMETRLETRALFERVLG